MQKRDLVEKVSATGEIKPKKNINISTDVAGKILKILVEEGQIVKKGQLLIKIDSAIYEANADRDREIISSSRLRPGLPGSQPEEGPAATWTGASSSSTKG